MRESEFERVFLLVMLLLAGALLFVMGRRSGDLPATPPAWAFRDVVLAPHREPHGLYRRIAGNAYEQVFERLVWRHAGIMFVDAPPPEPIMMHQQVEGGAVVERLSMHYDDYIYQICWRGGQLEDCGIFIEVWRSDSGWEQAPAPALDAIDWAHPEIVERQRWTLD